MAGIRTTHKLAKYGEELTSYVGQGQRAIDQLTSLRSRFPTLRDTINADGDLTTDEKAAAVAEVNSEITNLVTKIKTFADGL